MLFFFNFKDLLFDKASLEQNANELNTLLGRKKNLEGEIAELDRSIVDLEELIRFKESIVQPKLSCNIFISKIGTERFIAKFNVYFPSKDNTINTFLKLPHHGKKSYTITLARVDGRSKEGYFDGTNDPLLMELAQFKMQKRIEKLIDSLLIIA